MAFPDFNSDLKNNILMSYVFQQAMDTKFGPSWHAVIGEGFGFEITYEVKNLLYMFHAGTYSICLWKCA